MSWIDYMRMSNRQRRILTKKAINGDREARSSLLSYTREIKKEVNSRLVKLERSKMNYGKAYNNLIYFTENEYDSHRFKSPSGLGMDFYDMELQNNIGIKFLNNKSSTVSGARSVEQHRIKALVDLEVLPSDMKRRDQKEFLKFLGNEEISATVDEYGDSEIIVEMLYDAYKKGGSNALKIMRGALTEFLGRRITFDDAMQRVGIKVEDYFRGRPTS